MPPKVAPPLAPKVVRVFYLHLKAGLCNRLRTLLGYAFVAHRVSGQVYFCWTPDAHCNGRFQDHFLPVARCTLLSETDFAQASAHIGKAKGVERRHGERRAGTDVLFQGQRCLQDIVRQYGLSAALKKDVDPFVYQHLRLQPRLQAALEQLSRQHRLSQCTGVHVRRTDFVRDARQRHEFVDDEWFQQQMRQKLNQDPARRFLLATDNRRTQEAMHAAFPQRIVMYQTIVRQGQVKRHTDLEHAVMDLFALSECGDVIGSPGSSFSDLASKLCAVRRRLVAASPRMTPSIQMQKTPSQHPKAAKTETTKKSKTEATSKNNKTKP